MSKLFVVVAVSLHFIDKVFCTFHCMCLQFHSDMLWKQSWWHCEVSESSCISISD